MGFKDLPGGKNNKKNNASTEFSKEISPKSPKDKGSCKC